MRRLGKTPPFRGPRGEVVPGSIAEVAYRRLGGLDQWVMIRGESVANPALILLHGGPGFSETGFFRHFNAPLEKSFTAVYWDQRGAGKSFDRSIARSSMTVEQFISDLDELVDGVCSASARPRWRSSGTPGARARGAVRRAVPREGRGLRGLRADRRLGGGRVGLVRVGARRSATPSATAGRCGSCGRSARRRTPQTAVFTERTLVSRFEGQMRPRALWKVARAVLGGQESSIFELPSACAASGGRWMRCGRTSRA